MTKERVRRTPGARELLKGGRRSTDGEREMAGCFQAQLRSAHMTSENLSHRNGGCCLISPPRRSAVRQDTLEDHVSALG